MHAGVAPEQLPSDAHASHLPLFAPPVMQTPLRHCALDAHVPSPLAKPHLLSAASHAPLAQTAAPAAGVHVPFSAGEWPTALGMLVPFASCGTHAPALHQLPAPQSESRRHVALHAPVVVSQNGAPLLQGKVPALPLFPLHPVHVLVAALQSGVAPVHAPAVVDVHCTH